MRPTLLNPLFAPVTTLPGVGPKQDKLLRYLLSRDETPRLVDLLLHLPASVIDRRAQPKIREAVQGTVVTLEVTVDRHRPPPPRNSRAPYLVYASRRHRRRGADVLSAPSPAMSKSCCRSARSATFPARCRCMTASRRSCIPIAWSTRPDLQNSAASIRSIRSPKGWRSASLRRAIAQALQKLPELPEWISPEVIRRCSFPPITEALNRVHVPQELTDILPDGPFWSRLAFDELLAGQLALALVRAQLRRPAGDRNAGDGHLRHKIIDALPYALTSSQREAAAAIAEDLRQPVRMLRLLQGDVGSGKTVVALLAAAAVTKSAGRRR